MALVGAAVFTVVEGQPAVADVTAVQGSACGYFADVSLFGGPKNLRGCGQPAGSPADNASPSVTLPATGSATPITGADADGATAQYGPAKIFSGQYPSNDLNATSPPSGPLNVSTQGTTGAGGSVTSTASVTQGAQPPPGLPAQPRGVGPGPVIADAVSSTCTATETNATTGAKSVSASTTITNGKLETKYDAATQLPTVVENVPVNPPVNYTRSGTIDHVGDSYTVIYNEQIATGAGGITVNAVHLKLLGPTAVGDLVIAQSVCAITTAPGATTTTLAGATTTTQAGATTTTQAATTTTQAQATTTTAGATTTTGAGATTTTAATGEVSGGACGYLTDVSLFGGPKNLRGCGQPSSAPATNAAPSVTLPSGGSATPISATDDDGALAEYGPAKIFSGQYPSNDANATSPPSGPLSVSTQGTIGGSVTSSASVGRGSQPPPGLSSQPRGVGPGPIIADAVSSTCTAGASGVTGSVAITNGILNLSTTADGSPLNTEPVPANPPVNYTRTGVITNVGDNFRVVYNEQVTSGTSITVNAVHMFLLGPTAVGELVIAQSRCGRTAGGAGTGAGGGTATAAGSGGVASTGTNVLRTVAIALLLVAVGAHAKQFAGQLEFNEPLPNGGFRRRKFPRRVARPRRGSTKRPWS
jgi:hypothetical protein